MSSEDHTPPAAPAPVETTDYVVVAAKANPCEWGCGQPPHALRQCGACPACNGTVHGDGRRPRRRDGGGMRMVSPNTGAPETVIAEEQEQYMPISVAHYEDEEGRRHLLMRWRLNDDDKARIMSGDDLYVSLMTFGQPMQPIRVQVGADGWARLPHPHPDPRRGSVTP